VKENFKFSGFFFSSFLVFMWQMCGFTNLGVFIISQVSLEHTHWNPLAKKPQMESIPKLAHGPYHNHNHNRPMRGKPLVGEFNSTGDNNSTPLSPTTKPL
jgi:hypothetical protein